MKIAKIGILVGVLSILAFAIPTGYAQPTTSWTWTGKVPGSGSLTDPFFNQMVTAYSASSTASVNIALRNNNPSETIVVTSLKLVPDWGTNATVSGTPITLKSNGSPSVVTGSLPVPATSTASNLILHTVSLYANYNVTAFGSTSTVKDSNLVSISNFAVYNSDQTATWQSVSQLPFGASSSLFFSGSFLCTSFKTGQGNSKCQQAFQQASLAFSAYSTGDFATANTDMANAVSNYNSAVSSDSSTGGGLDLANTLGGYGGLLLGVGALIGGVGAIVYAFRRPKMMAAATHT